jgi:serine/threonine protein kinase
VLHQTGSGVLGPVFRAFDSPRDRLVAIKVFRLDVLPEQVVRLADALRRLQAAPPIHPLIVPLLDVGLEGTTPYVVMSFQPGETLDVVLRRAVPMPVERAIAILRPLAATLAAARESGVLHGALHPRDVYLPEDHDGLAGVTGFGIVQALEDAGLHNPLLRRPYVAPERATGTWDPRADVFSLGAIAHELLTGRRPAPSGEQDGVFAKEMPPEHRVHLRKVLTTALADQPEQRFVSCEALIAALEEAPHRAPTIAVNAMPAPSAVVVDGHAPIEPHETADTAFSSETADANEETSITASESEPVTAVAELPGPIVEVEEKVDEKEEAGVSPSSVIVPAAAQTESWIDTALASPSYALPAGIFDSGPVPSPRRPSVLVKTLAYAAAGLLIGAGGGLWVAQRWFDSPSETQALPRVVAKTDATPPPARTASVSSPEAPPVAAAAAEPEPAESPRETPPSAHDVRPAVAVGRLLVRSQPSGALVTIDGRHFGETPVVANGLAPGTYAVRVARPGHVPRTEKVTIRAAPAVRTLDVTLAPGLETGPAASATSTRGAIDVDSRPRGARVIVDGRFVGLSPLRLADVGPGEHQVTLEMGGYRSATGRVRVDAGHTAELTTTLRSIQ